VGYETVGETQVRKGDWKGSAMNLDEDYCYRFMAVGETKGTKFGIMVRKGKRKFNDSMRIVNTGILDVCPEEAGQYSVVINSWKPSARIALSVLRKKQSATPMQNDLMMRMKQQALDLDGVSKPDLPWTQNLVSHLKPIERSIGGGAYGTCYDIIALGGTGVEEMEIYVGCHTGKAPEPNRVKGPDPLFLHHCPCAAKTIINLEVTKGDGLVLLGVFENEKQPEK